MSKQAIHTLATLAILGTVAAGVAIARPGQGGGGFGSGQQARPGPSTLVPPEVAIPRPTQEELDKINADLKEYIAKSPDQELLRKWQPLLTVQMPRANSAVFPVHTGVRTTQRHNGFVATATNSDFDILFEGDSITDWWQQGGSQGGTEVFKKYFGGVKAANFAVAGDTTQGVLWGLKNGEGQGTLAPWSSESGGAAKRGGITPRGKPKAIMLMIGTNNTGGNSGPEIAEGVGAVVLELRRDFPNAKILLLAIFPRGAGPTDPLRVKNEEANKIIAKLDDGRHVFFRNINDKFLNAQEGLIGFRNDNLHPNAEGYEIWASAVAPTLKKWIN
jgi:lysophospholipase L1-like esterase